MDNANRDTILNSLKGSSEAKHREISDAVKRKDKNALMNSLSKEEREKLNSVLSDKQALSQFLKSPETKAAIKALFGGKNG